MFHVYYRDSKEGYRRSASSFLIFCNSSLTRYAPADPGSRRPKVEPSDCEYFEKQVRSLAWPLTL